MHTCTHVFNFHFKPGTETTTANRLPKISRTLKDAAHDLEALPEAEI
jgi:hypothetical protein